MLLSSDNAGMIKKKTALILSLVLIAAISSPYGSLAQVRGRDKKGRFSDAARVAAAEREDRIDEEISRLGEHEWSGEYYYGDGLGVNVHLTLAPKSGFVFTWHGCLGLYDLNYGDVRFEDGRVKLIFRYRNDRGGFRGIAPEFYPVRWGERHYLIASDEVINFCNAVNSGLEPCGWMCAGFLLRRGDEKKRAEGQPEIPAGFRQYLLAEPITARIISVERSRVEKDEDGPELKFRISEVTLSAGRAEGILVGMELHSYDPPNAVTAEVIEAYEYMSKARIVQVGTEGDKPRSGWRLSTRLIDNVLPPK